ncbi:hypothetical protein P3W85_35970 [Cupriavidus basilensis]|uniref:DUF2235 domain-containing protein n=1 Tax=Cupriavidus basilensis TaxID=68895 RepID=A0ABT6B082_9BURK|nr:hypothetical protein [Cupriavidus basilensis]MDF3838289.1 hypothetical protein [Cupriavidus basilensis]
MTISRLPDNMGDNPWALTQNERKGITCTESPDDAMSCQRTLYLGFFFDGTRNNRKYDTKPKSHSNVARLYDVFDEARQGLMSELANGHSGWAQPRDRRREADPHRPRVAPHIH